MNNAGKLTAVLIAAFSLLLVFGALLTALAENGFTAIGPEKTSAPNNASNPTATPIILPTKEVAPTKELDPTKVEPTTAPEKTKPPEKTQETDQNKTPTTTATATKTKTAAATESGACTKPDGWKDYKVKSGDTLFAISVLFQTDVATLKSGNCLTTNQIITGKILWVPNTATLTPTKTEKPDSPTKEPKPTHDGCYLLTLKHLGNGADATGVPTNSVDSAAGKYKAGETITLTAAPDPGWVVGSWYGTTNNGSTALTNNVTMPASDHMAKPIYVPICYALTVTNGMNGDKPLPDITKSSGCNLNEYVEGETITFTPQPDPLYTVDTWTGTNGGTNVLTMPAAAAAVHVTYAVIPPPCFTLTLGVTSGAGSVPTAPASGSGCSAGEYTPGESIPVTAAPTGSGVVGSWQTSLLYVTTAPNVITITMSTGASSVFVTYNP